MKTKLLAFGLFLAAYAWMLHRVSAQSIYEPYTFTTLAGNAGYGSTDGTGSAARFLYPSGVSVDSASNLYVADAGNHTIRKVTPARAVTTLAGLAGYTGSADGTGSAARFAGPSGVAVDSASNLYVADAGNHTIRKVTPAGAVTTLAGLADSPGSTDGIGSAARFNHPQALAVDSADNVYVADTDNNTIRKVTPAGAVTTLAGLADSPGSTDGIGSAARFNHPEALAVDSAGNVYVADTGNDTIRKVTLAGAVTTLAGLAGGPGSADGVGNSARFYGPSGVAVDTTGNLYVADSINDTIRKVTPAGGVTTLAGLADSPGSTDGIGSAARFNHPQALAVDSAGNVYVADSGNTIRKVTAAAEVTTLAGLAGRHGSADGVGNAVRFYGPTGVAVDSVGNVYVADTGNNTIRKVTPEGVVTTLAGLAQLDRNGESVSGSADGTGDAARFNQPWGVAVDSAGNLYVADSGNNTIRKVTPTGVVTTLAGLAGSRGSADGTGSSARFGGSDLSGNVGPSGVAVDSAGNLYVADSGNHTIRKVTPAGEVTTLAGMAGEYGLDDGTGSAARFAWPKGVAADSVGNIFVADSFNHNIRKVTSAGVVTKLAGWYDEGSEDGTGSAARFNRPYGVAVDSSGNVFVADSGNSTIRKVTPAGVVTTLAGLARHDNSGTLMGAGNADGTGSAARFGGGIFGTGGPGGVAVDSGGNIYVADTSNNTIRKGYPAVRLLNSGFNGVQFGFVLTGPAGHLVVVEASTELVNWQPICTNIFAVGLNFSDPQSGVHTNSFYRARLVRP